MACFFPLFVALAFISMMPMEGECLEQEILVTDSGDMMSRTRLNVSLCQLAGSANKTLQIERARDCIDDSGKLITPFIDLTNQLIFLTP